MITLQGLSDVSVQLFFNGACNEFIEIPRKMIEDESVYGFVENKVKSIKI